MANTTSATPSSSSSEKKKPIRHTSAKVEALFCHLVTVDHGTKEYPDEVGSYNITLRMDAAEAVRFRAKLSTELEDAEDFMNEQFAKLKPATRAKYPNGPTFNMIGTDEYDKETEEPTGNVLFRIKTKASYTDRQGRVRSRRVPLFDSMGQPVTLSEEIGFGSLVRVSFTAIPYFVDGQAMAGLALYLEAIQIVKLNKFGERSASDYGFAEEEEGGFSADEIDTDATAATSTSAQGQEQTLPSEAVSADEVLF